ncbi:MAG TPA: nickel pincer cofactor biosynthesis protein LarB [Nitrososphaerales archaeon]|nr:nickel pincer cofactor biosynthesis protein LarB [Nitrososphaerales archaeon]
MHSVADILKAVRNGTLNVGDAQTLLRLDAIAILGDIARIDATRYLRRGVPEIIYAASKKDSHLEAIVSGLLETRSRRLKESPGTSGEFSMPIVFSKIRDHGQAEVIINAVKRFNALGMGSELDKRRASDSRTRRHKFVATFDESANILTIAEESNTTLRTRKREGKLKRRMKKTATASKGRVALISAGTSDIPALNEAEAMLRILGCETLRFNDVGVAGLHRLLRPMKEIARFDPDAVIVAAGMEGALPSIVAGLSAVPVVGLPTSVGYGYGGRGEASLMSMLQACPLGIAVVNIDAGVAAAVIAYLIAKRSHQR